MTPLQLLRSTGRYATLLAGGELLLGPEELITAKFRDYAAKNRDAIVAELKEEFDRENPARVEDEDHVAEPDKLVDTALAEHAKQVLTKFAKMFEGANKGWAFYRNNSGNLSAEIRGKEGILKAVAYEGSGWNVEGIDRRLTEIYESLKDGTGKIDKDPERDPLMDAYQKTSNKPMPVKKAPVANGGVPEKSHVSGDLTEEFMEGYKA